MKKFNVNQFIRTDIVRMKSYIPGTSAEDLAGIYKQGINQLIKLNANENPYGASPAIEKILKNTLFNYYPRSDYPRLCQKIANYAKVKSSNITVGSGSDEIIDLILRSVLNEKDKVIICPPTFGMYKTLTKLNRGTVINVPRKKDYSINVAEIIKRSKDKNLKVIFICNPNSPTGNLTSQEDLIKVLNTDKLVILDEAYFEFSKTTSSLLLDKYPNLAILRTFSKWAGLAGLRIGYAIGSESFINQIMKIKPPFNVNIAAENAALATLKYPIFAKKSIEKIVTERELMYSKLKNMPGILVYLSYGNFIFLQVKKKNNYIELQKKFEENKIALRYYSDPENSIRITIGKPNQNKKVVSVLKNFFDKKKYAFIDRDGTLIYEPQDNFQIDSVKKLKVLSGVIKGLKKLKKRKYKLIMISNQDGLGTSSFPISNFQKPQEKFMSILKSKKIVFNKTLICPHLPSYGCTCRKPKIGLIKDFLDQINVEESFVIGDRNSDKKLAESMKIKYLPMKTNGDFYKALTNGGI